MGTYGSRLAVVCAVFMFLPFVQGCGDFSVRLPQGYVLSRVYAGAVVISHPTKGIVVDANIDAYAVVDKLIVGHVVSAEFAPEKKLSKPGYFLINTGTHEVHQGLAKSAWMQALKKLGVNDEPVLNAPSRFDRDY